MRNNRYSKSSLATTLPLGMGKGHIHNFIRNPRDCTFRNGISGGNALEFPADAVAEPTRLRHPYSLTWHGSVYESGSSAARFVSNQRHKPCGLPISTVSPTLQGTGCISIPFVVCIAFQQRERAVFQAYFMHAAILLTAFPKA